MDLIFAINAFGALAQSTRLRAFCLLVEHEPDGLPAGDIARRLDVPQNTMSVHLATLARAGLIQSERQSRQVIYRADCERAVELATFLSNDCCRNAGRLISTPHEDAKA